jgi:modification methylase
VWEFLQDKKNEHPAPFPVALPNKIISSVNASLIYDPFMGSGTTALAAIMNKRNYIGSEIAPEYCKMAEQRILYHQAQLGLF